MKPIDRREFIAKGAAGAAAAGLSGTVDLNGWGALARAAEPAGAKRQLAPGGPPPRKSPQRQPAAESMPPLPLPATPLRRSEPKAEPKAPMMVAKLEYGTTQDWNTDPGDVDNLMRHCQSALGLWY